MTLRRDSNELRNRQARRGRALEVSDPVLAFCWYGIVESLDRAFVSLDEIRRTVATGGDCGGGDFDLRSDGERVVVSFWDGEDSCLLHDLLPLLDAIAADTQAGPAETTEPASPESAHSPTDPDVAERLGPALGLDLRELAGGDLDTLLKTLGSILQGLQDHDRAAREEAGAAARAFAAELETRGVRGADRLASLPELLQTSQDQLDPANLADHLRTLADWIEGQDPGAGKRVGSARVPAAPSPAHCGTWGCGWTTEPVASLRSGLAIGHEIGGNVSGIERAGRRVSVYFLSDDASCDAMVLLAELGEIQP